MTYVDGIRVGNRAELNRTGTLVGQLGDSVVILEKPILVYCIMSYSQIVKNLRRYDNILLRSFKLNIIRTKKCVHQVL